MWSREIEKSRLKTVGLDYSLDYLCVSKNAVRVEVVVLMSKPAINMKVAHRQKSSVCKKGGYCYVQETIDTASFHTIPSSSTVPNQNS